MNKISITISALFLSFPALAQEQARGQNQNMGPADLILIIFIITVVLLLIVAYTLLNTFKSLSNELINPTPFAHAEQTKIPEWDEWYAFKKSKPPVLNKLLGLRPISEEKDIQLEHEFDGIAELDNPTPGWFMVLFYATIFFGVIYLFNFHVSGWGKMQEEEYVIEMNKAKAEKTAYLAKSNNNIDETSVNVDKDAGVLAAGAALYKTNCVACHGDKGQGVVGPNLTDDYWLHGGKINNVFKTIKYGVPEKGMISWEKVLSPKQISDVSNYIESLKGTNPANAKAPQGEKEG